MSLTPTDVANKQFRIAFRGYALNEVDAFLDEVETELTRLLRDNAELKNAPSGPAVASAAAAAPLSGMVGQEAALRTLLLAQRTADEAIAEARAEAEQIVTSARDEATSTLGSAKSEAEGTLGSAKAEAQSALAKARADAESAVSKARAEAESTLGKARAEAEATMSASKQKADRLDADIAERIHAATGDLDAKRRDLEHRIDELRAFEREYRTRLKAYLETQLHDLDSRQGPEDRGVGVPAGARAAAVGPAGSVARPSGLATPPAPVVPAPAPASAPAPAASPAAPPANSADSTTSDVRTTESLSGPPSQASPAPLRSVPSDSDTNPFTPVSAFHRDSERADN